MLNWYYFDSDLSSVGERVTRSCWLLLNHRQIGTVACVYTHLSLALSHTVSATTSISVADAPQLFSSIYTPVLICTVMHTQYQLLHLYLLLMHFNYSQLSWTCCIIKNDMQYTLTWATREMIQLYRLTLVLRFVQLVLVLLWAQWQGEGTKFSYCINCTGSTSTMQMDTTNNTGILLHFTNGQL